MKIVSWNVRRANSKSDVWDVFSKLNPDIALLQEVTNFSPEIQSKYKIIFENAIAKTCKPQKFGTAILTKGEITEEIKLKSEYDWVNNERELFYGNLLCYKIRLSDAKSFNVISVYSPAWPIDEKRIKGIDISSVKLEKNSQLWHTEILWSCLKNTIPKTEHQWIVGGDFNSSETFDYLWSGGPRGCKDLLDRMNALGLIECLRHYQGVLTPTFKNPKGGKILHQLDHIYVSETLIPDLTSSNVGDKNVIFENSLSDHLPVIAFLK